MKCHFFRILLLAGASALLLPAPGRAQSVPPLLNYQGRVVVGSTNFNGNGLFKFALVSSDGATTYWSNDGTRRTITDLSANGATRFYRVLISMP